MRMLRRAGAARLPVDERVVNELLDSLKHREKIIKLVLPNSPASNEPNELKKT